MLRDLRQAIKGYRMFVAGKRALLRGMEDGDVSKTKLGAVLLGVGAIVTLVAKIINGEMDIASAIPQALAAIGAMIAIIGGRDAITKLANGNGK
jgi:hypothetical protein